MDGLSTGADGAVIGAQLRDDANGPDAAGALHDLYLAYAPLLLHLAIGRFRIPADDAEALVHDVFATYLTDPTRITSVRAYLVGGICNASRSYWRARDRHIELAEASEPVVDERTADRIATRLDLARALSKVGARCREALRRYYVDDESTRTIAAVLDTTPTNVNYLLHVCRKRARAVFDLLTRCT